MYAESAGFGQRLLAYLIDGFIVGLIAGVPGGCVGAASATVLDVESETGILVLTALIFLAVIVGLVGSVLYYGLLWSRTGQTPGKKLMGLKVVTADGMPPSFWRAVGRALIGYALSGAILDLGFLWMLWDEGHQTWHDKIFGTYVIRV